MVNGTTRSVQERSGNDRLIYGQLLSLPRMPTARLGTMAESALGDGDWPLLGLVHSELAFRGSTDDAAARVLQVQLENVKIPEVVEAQTLLGEGRQLTEWVASTLRSIETGEEDLGVKLESYSQQWAARQAAKEQGRIEQAHARADAKGGPDLPPAA